jgi:hypothetical protein
MDAERLLQMGSDEWRRSLLQAGAGEVVPEAVTAQVLAALEALGPGLGDAATNATATGPKAAIALRAPVAPLAGWSTLKLTTLLAGLVGVGLCASWFAARSAHEPPPAAPLSAARSESPSVGSGPVGQAIELAPAPDDQPLNIGAGAAARSAAAARPAAPPRSQRAASTGDGLRRELQLLTGARARVRSGDAAAALSLLQRYRRAFPHGVLKQEADELERRAQQLAAGAR